MTCLAPDWSILKRLGIGVATVAVLALAPAAALAGKFKVLHSFCAKAGCADGSGPVAPLVRDAAGNLFGTTDRYGKNEFGTAFELVNLGDGKYKAKTIYSFDNYEQPGYAGLILDTVGNLYGWTQTDRFFKLSYGYGAHHDKWARTDISLTCAQQPCSGTHAGSLTYAGAASGAPWDGASPLYGTMGEGGTNNSGAVYQLVPTNGSWNYTELYHFCAQQNCADGSTPVGFARAKIAQMAPFPTSWFRNPLARGARPVHYERPHRSTHLPQLFSLLPLV